MLQFQTFFNTEELERLNRCGQLPESGIVGTVRRYMAGGNAILLLVRNSGSWDVEGVFVDVPAGKETSERKMVTVFSDIDALPLEFIQDYLRSNHFTKVELHTPATTTIDGTYATWAVLRHIRQAPGLLDTLHIHADWAVEDAVGKVNAAPSPERLEIFIHADALIGARERAKLWSSKGFVTRKFIYEIAVQ